MPAKDSSAWSAGHRRTVSSTSTKSTLTAQAGNSYVASSTEQIQYSHAESSSISSFKTSSRIMNTVRRSIGSFPKKRGQESSNTSAYGMISTPAERSLPTSTRYRDSTASRPTIEQIAMGLHTSRTPHLRPLNTGHLPVPQSRRVLPPPPARPSLKQTSSSPATLAEDVPASASSSTLASTNPSSKTRTTPMSSIKVRMARFLPRTRISSAPPSVFSSFSPSPRTSTEVQTPKKAVRFSVLSEA